MAKLGAVRLWRVVKRRHAATAFDGKAAQRFGGRWNSPGRRAVYASANKSLAVLEVLVHLDVGRRLPRFVAFTFEVDAKLVDRLPAAQLPRQWRTARGMLATQQIGDEWLASGRALALAVPSTVVPEELNYLLNPAHPAFGRLRFGRPIPFLLDPRLAG
jgi:RES domain-containing protein